MNKTRKNIKKHIIFSDHPDFTPNLTPREMFYWVLLEEPIETYLFVCK